MEESGKDQDSVECPICLTLHPLQNLLQTKCDHKFCRSCVASLFKDELRSVCPLCRRTVTPYDTVRISTQRALAEQPTTIYGGVYVQAGTVGLASYHFSPEESYICYSAAPTTWRLDDGAPPPVRKPFLNATYDSSSRTFRAVVDWSEVNFGGDAEWIYRMVFSEEFSTIERGEVVSYDAMGRKGMWHVYEQDLFYERLEKIDFEV